MKKLLLVLIAVMGMTFAANAQSKNAIGLRFGTDAEISYQMAMGNNNRLELDFGANGFLNWNVVHYFSVTGIYQWHWNIIDTFGWYVGPGVQVSLWQASNTYFNISVGGQIGIDYEIPSIPLQVSLDTRPMWNFLGTYAGFGWGACLGVRYTF